MSHIDAAQGDDTASMTDGDTQVTRPMFTIREACDVCQVSRRTITRRLDELADHGATKDAGGHWLVPVEALEAVGLRRGRPTGPDAVTSVSDTGQISVADTGAQTVTLSLDEYKELLKAAAERDGLARELDRADDTVETMKQAAWQWYEQAQLVQRQLPTAGAVVDVREQKPTKRKGLFNR